MFRKHYQGGAVVEVFSGQGKDPVAKWRLCGGPSAIHKEYNKEVKGFVYCLEGSSRTVKMQMPENGKMSLGLLQRFLVLQVNIPQGKDFSIELMITDLGHLKRRLYLSTVHKELSTTLWHAKIPFIGLQRNIWSTLCIDLVSFTRELYSDTGFLTLDGITLFAACKVRRIFTMKTEPTGDDELSLSGPGLTDLIPRSCKFPPHVNHVSQLWNMEILLKALKNPDCAPDHSTADTSPSDQSTGARGVPYTPSGSRAAGPLSSTRGKSRAASDGVGRNVYSAQSMRSLFSTSDQKSATESERITHMIDNSSNREPFPEGTPGSLQPHPPKDRIPDKQGSEKKKLRVYIAGRERLASSYVVPAGDSERNKREVKGRGRCAAPSYRQEGRQQPLTEGKTENLAADKIFRAAAPTPTESPSSSIQPGLSSDLQVWSSWESNEESEPLLTLHEEVSSLHEQVFTFSSQPHSPKRGQSQSDQEKMEMGDNQIQNKRGKRYEAQLEDDFVGSESDEDMSSNTFQHQIISSDSNPVASKSPDPTLIMILELHPDDRNIHQTSPNEEEDKISKPVEPSDCDLPLVRSLRLHGGEDEELRMLASLKREQEEDEHRASGLSASQIHHCNVSVSMSSDDNLTWTDISMPANQGHHYQKEMNPLQCSNPREWMDVLSPPIMPPGQQRRSDNTGNHCEDRIRGEDELANGEENADEYLNLLYDPCLNCYFDPKTGKYYELA